LRQCPAPGGLALRRRRWLDRRRLFAIGQRCIIGSDRRRRLQLLQPQLELLDRALDLLRRAAELHAPQPRNLQLQLLDLERLRQETGLGGRELRCTRLCFGSLSEDDLMQGGDVGGQRGAIESHARI